MTKKFDKAAHCRDVGMKPGETRNTKGNSKVRVRKSKLRELADKLRERQDIALALIDKSLASEDASSDAVASAKWVINSIVSVEKAANNEEITNFTARTKGKRDEQEPGEQTPAEIEKEMRPRLSLVYEAREEDDDE